MAETRTQTLQTTFKGRVVLTQEAGGATRVLPLSAIQATFVINAMPQAQIVIPVGEAAPPSPQDDVQVTEALLNDLLRFQRIECWVQISGEFAPGVFWPETEFRIFNGFVTTATTVHTDKSMGIMLEATHWMMDLDASSTLSEAVAVGAPLAFVLPSVDDSGAMLKANASDPDLAEVLNDFWVGALKPKLIKLASEGTLADGLDCAPDPEAGFGVVSNDLAIRRLQGTGPGIFDQSDLIDVPKIVFVGNNNPFILDTVRQTITGMLAEGSLGRTSMWDKLLELVDEFQLTLIPTIDSATIAPLAPCLGSSDPPRHITIYADEQFSLRPSSGVVRYWRGVALLGQLILLTGAMDSSALATGDWNPTAVGCYLADRDETLPDTVREQARRGTLRYMRPPSWLDDVTVQGEAFVTDSLQPTAIDHSMIGPEVGPPVEPVDNFSGLLAPDPRPAAFEERQTLGKAYARWLYWVNQFRLRNGELNGKFRLDIAPGSLVRIEDPATPETSITAQYLYGMVSSVRFHIDTINQSAGTTFTLTSLRRDSEKRLGDERHPLYKSGEDAPRWVGTVLQRIDMVTKGQGRLVPVPGTHESQ